MKRLRLIIASVWLVIATAIGMSCIADIYSASHRGRNSEVHAALIFLGFSVVGISGAFLTLRNRRLGPPILYVGSAYGLWEGSTYGLCGGGADTGRLYASAVGILILLSLATLIGVRREVHHGL